MIAKSGTRFSDKIMRQQESTEHQLHITRREFCKSTAAIALATVALGAFALPPFPSDALAESIPVADLMKPDAMPDLALGDDKAPVTIVEYASMTCPHCAHFHETTYPELKKRYIDTGKVRFIMREFPLDPLAAAGFMLARCSAQEPAKGANPVSASDAAIISAQRYHAMVETLFSQQHDWVV